MKKGQWLIWLMAIVLLSGCGSAAARYNNRGNRDFEAEKFDEAIKDYTTAQQENPDLAEPYYNAGNTHHRQENLEGAVAQLKQSLRGADDELKQQAYYNLGNTYFQAQDWSAAIEAYQQALLLNPDDMDAKQNLELALQKLLEQQQQQQQQQGGGGQQQDNQQDQQGQQQQQEQQGQQDNQDQENESGQGQQPDQPDQSGGSQPPDQQQQAGGQGGLSRSEAEQLLDALGQDSQTLQERLQRQLGQPAPRPDRDW
ncbi:MAG: tetratricopeptide repeat protein [Anaerolineae bacterium]|nr:tetratricopeptide repeat protein [Anaerolineae bacterium]